MKKWISIIITASFLILTGWFTVFNFPVVYRAVSDSFGKTFSLRDLSADVTAAMKSDDFFHKDDFINLAGLYGRVSGRRLFNEVIRMKNGMLNYGDMELKPKGLQISESLAEFKDFVEERGARFFYVQFPGKYDKDNVLMPDGLSSQIMKEITGLVDLIQRTGVDVLDIRLPFTETPAEIEQYFYRTDHHWRPSAAFAGLRMILDYLQPFFPEESYQDETLDISNWTVHELPGQFLGSKGRRVGIYFGGLDALEWMTPDFETDLSFYYPEKQQFLKGDYEKAFIRDEYLDPDRDKMRTDYYNVYIGGNYPFVQTKNTHALSDQRVLLIHDSFSFPLISFLSLVFREVDSIDPRSYRDMTMTEYADRMRPDLVIMALAPYADIINDEVFFRFSNGNDALFSEDSRLITEQTVTLEKSGEDVNFAELNASFENEKYYTLYVPDVRVTDGEAEAFSAALYDIETHKTVNETIMETEYCSRFGDCSWTFQTPWTGSENLRLIIYAGIAGETEDIGLQLPDVRLSERETISGTN